MLLGALSVAAIGFLIWLLFTLAVYALPLWTGLSAGMFACETGAGLVGAVVVGIVAAGLSLAKSFTPGCARPSRKDFSACCSPRLLRLPATTPRTAY